MSRRDESTRLMLTPDQLGKMSDDEIYRRKIFLQGLRDRNRFDLNLMKYAEEELCFIHREQELREVRFDAHEIYLKNNRHFDFY